MLAESSSQNNPPRYLRQEEFDLLCAMLKDDDLVAFLSTAPQVRDLHDGGMGSIEFVLEDSRGPRQARCYAEADYMDSDGTPVNISVNIDQFGKLFELDIWKVDFGRLKTYPTGWTIRNIRRADG